MSNAKNTEYKKSNNPLNQSKLDICLLILQYIFANYNYFLFSFSSYFYFIF